jgi:hypothetical protein
MKPLATFAAGSTAVAAALAGIATTTAPPANAAPKFSAIAYSSDNGAWGWSMLAGSEQQAVDVAMNYCAQAGGTNCARMVASGPGGCVALGRRPDGYALGAIGSTHVGAQERLELPNDGKVLVTTCSGLDEEPANPTGAPGVSPLPAAPPPPPVEVPKQVEVAPKDAIRVDIERSAFNVKVTVTNTADLAGKCTYAANPVGNPLLPAVNRNFDIGAKGSQQLSFLAPPPLSTYHVVVSCIGTFNGQNVEFGHVEQDVSG